MDEKRRELLNQLKPDERRTLLLIGQQLSRQQVQDREQIGESGYYARLDRIHAAPRIASLPRARRWGELMLFAQELLQSEPDPVPPKEAPKAEEKKARGMSLGKLKERNAPAGRVLAALLLVIAGVWVVMSWPGGSSVTLVRPHDGDSVEYIDAVEGTVSGLRDGDTIWVLITDEDDNVYHPQVGPAVRFGENGWRVVGVRFGEERTLGIGKRYRISTAVADSQATSAFQEYVGTGRQSTNFPGFRQLPAGAQLQAQSVIVHR